MSFELSVSNLFPDSDDEDSDRALRRLPLKTSDFADPTYWAKRYAAEGDLVYDWYGLEYPTFWNDHLAAVRASGASSLLEIGCGNSSFAASMAASGFAVTSTDIDFGILASQTTSEPLLLERLVVDACQLPFRDGTFDVVVEKGTLDALWCGEAPKKASEAEADAVSASSKRRSGTSRTPKSAPISSKDTSHGEVPLNHNNHECVVDENLPPKQKSSTWGSALIAKVAEQVCRVLRDGGVWFIISAKEPWLMLESMNVTSREDIANANCEKETLIAANSGRRSLHRNGEVRNSRLEIRNNLGGLQSFVKASRLQIDYVSFMSGVYVIKLSKICKEGRECSYFVYFHP